MFKYSWERGSREESLEIQERRHSFWSEVLKKGAMGFRDRKMDGGRLADGGNMEEGGCESQGH